MKIKYEDEIKFEGKRLWIHADFSLRDQSISMINIRAYDMYPQSDYDEVTPTRKLIQYVIEAIEDEIYG